GKLSDVVSAHGQTMLQRDRRNLQIVRTDRLADLLQVAARLRIRITGRLVERQACELAGQLVNQCEVGCGLRAFVSSPGKFAEDHRTQGNVTGSLPRESYGRGTLGVVQKPRSMRWCPAGTSSQGIPGFEFP